MAKIKHLRLCVQAVWAVATNAYIPGFLSGRIYQGKLKYVCVPGMNCYSCPGALFSCPIGALQSVMGSRMFSFSFYVVGFLAAVGALAGRFVCGWLCPFGWIQELLHKLPLFRKLNAFRGDRILRKLKYAVLLVFVVLLPLVVVDVIGQGTPFFCKWICPVGTVEGGIPLVVMNPSLQAAAGALFAWKNVILVVLVLSALFIYRPFCKYICPLGAVYSVLNPISLYHISVERDKCLQCGACGSACKMGVNPMMTPASAECIRCGECVRSCPEGALRIGFSRRGERRCEGGCGRCNNGRRCG